MTNPDLNKLSSANMKFICPHCGEISRDDVVFLCNTCKQEELVVKDEVYICPTCLVPGENFQCMICDSKEVKLKVVEKTA
jgi:predicted RNA-binding Zn-ribbon protein involved in translation (DUF1610 family)